MIRLADKQIKEIAESLDCGFKCYLNRKTNEIKSILDSDNLTEYDEDPWKEDIEEIEKHPDDYVEFAGMESRDAFQVMVDFTDQVNDMNLKEKLYHALNNRNPFRYFKWRIDNSGRNLLDFYRVEAYLKSIKGEV